jgi:hypothetical protein
MGLRNRNFLEPRSRLGCGLHDGFHRFPYTMTLSADFADSLRQKLQAFRASRELTRIGIQSLDELTIRPEKPFFIRVAVP